MACDVWAIEQMRAYNYAYNLTTQVFLNIYYVECVLKLIGFGWSYFLDNWCRFDFFLVVTSLLDTYASELLSQATPQSPPPARALSTRPRALTRAPSALALTRAPPARSPHPARPQHSPAALTARCSPPHPLGPHTALARALLARRCCRCRR